MGGPQGSFGGSFGGREGSGCVLGRAGGAPMRFQGVPGAAFEKVILFFFCLGNLSGSNEVSMFSVWGRFRSLLFA